MRNRSLALKCRFRTMPDRFECNRSAIPLFLRPRIARIEWPSMVIITMIFSIGKAVGVSRCLCRLSALLCILSNDSSTKFRVDANWS